MIYFGEQKITTVPNFSRIYAKDKKVYQKSYSYNYFPSNESNVLMKFDNNLNDYFNHNITTYLNKGCTFPEYVNLSDYIAKTNIEITNKSKIIIEFSINQLTEQARLFDFGETGIFGGVYLTSSNSCLNCWAHNYYNPGSWRGPTPSTTTTKTTLTFDIKNNAHSTTGGMTYSNTGGLRRGTINNSAKAKLFLFGSEYLNSPMNIRFYSAQVYQNEVLTNELIPMVNSYSGEIYIYDQITKDIYYNSKKYNSFPELYTWGKFDQAFNCGFNNAFSIDYDNTLAITNQDWTIGCWLKRDLYESGWREIFGISAGYTASNVWIGSTFKLDNANNRMECKYRTSATAVTSWYVNNIDTYIPRGEWVYFVITKQNTTLKIFANGQIINTQTVNQTMYNAQTPIYVGCCHSTTESDPSAVQQIFSGRIDEFFFINGTALYTSNFQVPKDPFGPYTELEYIESTGTQYIDTDFKHNQNTRMIADIDFNPSTYWQSAFGSWGGPNASPKKFFGGEYSTTGNYNAYYGNGASATISSSYFRGRKIWDWNKNVYNTGGYSKTFTATTFQSQFNDMIFARSGYDGGVAGFAQMKLYSFKIYDNETLIRDFIPILDYTGRPCLLDNVNGKFYYNKGTGEFIPSHHEIEYIESTGEQYLNTNVNMTSNISANLNFQLTELQTSAHNSILTSYTDGVGSGFTFAQRSNNNNFAVAFGSSWNSTEVSADLLKHTIKINNNGKCLLDNQILISTAGSAGLNSNLPILICAWASGSTANRFGYLKIYSCKIYNNGTLIRNYLPALDKNNIACLFDKVERKLYYNQGTGNFLYPS